MKRSVRARGLALAGTAALVVSVAFVAPASAALPQHVSCAKLSVPKSGSKTPSTISSCTPAALQAGATSKFKSPPKGSKAGTLSGTFTWKNGKGTTVTLVSFKVQATPGKCPVGTSRVTLTGKVTGGTGAAAKIIKKGEPVTASICAYTAGPNTGKSSLEPGTKFKM
jgi:hypothetical protein